MIFKKQTPIYSKSILDSSKNQEFPAAFSFQGYTYYVDQDDYDDETNTIAVNNENGISVKGIKANQMLVKAVDTYCKEGGNPWLSEQFKGSISLYREENNL